MSSHEDQHGRVTDGSLVDFATVRRVAFYLSVVGALALYAVMMGEMLTFVFVGWFQEPSIHHFHELVLFGLIWLGILGLATQLYRPDERVNAVLVSAVVMVPLAVIAVSSNSPIAMIPILFGVIGLVVVALHPAGRSLFDFERNPPGKRTLGGLLAVAVVPFLVYAGDQLVTQFTTGDSHAAFVHYGGVTMVAVIVLVLGLLATVRERDRRFAAWSAGGLAGYFGLAAVLYPEQTSSVGGLWGTLAILWGVAFIAAFELSRDRAFVSVDSTIEIDAPIETVWEVTTDPATFVEGIDWVSEAWWDGDSSPGEGAVYYERAKPGLKENTYRWEITAYEPPNRIVHYHKGSELEAELEVLTESIDEGTTRYTQAIRFRAFPVFRPLGYVLERTVMKRKMQQDFDEMILPNYKRIVEARVR